MSSQLLPTTRMAIRAAVSTVIALILTRLVLLERPYWVILTAVILGNETWGENIRKAGMRLGMTILGCVVGWILYDLTAFYPASRAVCLLGGIFLAVYFRTGVPVASFAPMTFFITMYVVFLFAALGLWTPRLMLARVYDTGLGCAIALMVSAVVLPRQASQQLESDLADFFKDCHALLTQSCNILAGTDRSMDEVLSRHEMLHRLEKMQALQRAAIYEGWFGDRPVHAGETFLQQTERLCRSVLVIAAVAEYPAAVRVGQSLREELANVLTQLTAQFQGLTGADPCECTTTLPATAMRDLEDAIDRSRQSHLTDPADAVYFKPFPVYLAEVSEVLADLAGQKCAGSSRIREQEHASA